MHQCYTNYAKPISTKIAAGKRWSRLHRMKRGLTIGSVEEIAIRIVLMLQGAIQQLTTGKVMVIAIQTVSLLQGEIRQLTIEKVMMIKIQIVSVLQGAIQIFLCYRGQPKLNGQKSIKKR